MDSDRFLIISLWEAHKRKKKSEIASHKKLIQESDCQSYGRVSQRAPPQQCRLAGRVHIWLATHTKCLRIHHWPLVFITYLLICGQWWMMRAHFIFWGMADHSRCACRYSQKMCVYVRVPAQQLCGNAWALRATQWTLTSFLFFIYFYFMDWANCVSVSVCPVHIKIKKKKKCTAWADSCLGMLFHLHSGHQETANA